MNTQREIKFRAWDKEKKQMRDVTGINWYDEYIWVDETPMSGDKLPIESASLMQYTGLKDKNGKEIYEWDILEWTDSAKQLGVVNWWEGDACYGIDEDEINDGKPNLGGFDCGLNGLDCIRCKGYSVVGNIYQNPELLITHNI